LSNQVFFYTSTFGLECIGDDVASLIGCLSDSTPLLWREILESLEDGRELARLAKYLIAIVDESRFVRESWEMSEDARLESVYLLDHKKEK
jgi:hypothetical protein